MQKHPISKYRPFGASHAIPLKDRRWPERTIEAAPRWCSVDLRDGNQALAIPMNVPEKSELFALLCRIGFKEIEIGFPSASDTEFAFCRELIEGDHIPEDVTIQCLVQCREHLVRRTFEGLRGARQAIVHFYNSTNPLQRRVTFGKTRSEIRDIAVAAARLIRELESHAGGTRIVYQYSPESFSDTEIEFSLEVCEAVMDVLEPTPERKMILNLPATVELCTPNIHADQIEYFGRHLSRRDSVYLSLHTHNDRGTGVAATELGLLAGADRVEGTLFGNGERTGNVDLVTLALNLYTQGVDPGLDFSNLPEIRAVAERVTRMEIPPRHPYAGDLVFTAFSGSHQDAIKKGMDQQVQSGQDLWEVPYLPIDPEDIGRSYKAIIRINSQSGKGGVAYVLEHEFGLSLPRGMHAEIGAVVTAQADAGSAELSPGDIKDIFWREYIQRNEPLSLLSYLAKPTNDEDHHNIRLQAQVNFCGQRHSIEGAGNGPISAFVDAIKRAGWKEFRLMHYSQHAITAGSSADAITFICLERASDRLAFWGVSVESNIELAGLKALVSAFNRAVSG
jgi:2-isopropylmalate synthase